MSILLRRVRLYGTDKEQALELAIEGDKIIAIGQVPASFRPQRIIDAQGMFAIPGIVDLGVYMREPGYEHKATIASESKAAVAAGVTTLVCMPQTRPVIDSPTTVELIRNRAVAASLCRVLIVGAATKGLHGKELSEMGALKKEGCIAVSNLFNPFAELAVLKRVLEYASGFGLPVFFHPQDASLSNNGCAHNGTIATRLGLTGIPVAAETAALSQCLALVEDTGATVHFCRLSCARSVGLLQKAQASGLPVSADVAIHQLLLTESNLTDFNSSYHVLPPLRSEDDRLALLEGLNEGVIGAICSDHQPHDIGSKLVPFPSSAPGISALETFLPLVLRLVDDGALKPAIALQGISASPATILGIDAGRLSVGAPADICLFDPREVWQLCAQTMYSSGSNTPFYGQHFSGRVRFTICGGEPVYEAR